MFSPSLHKYFEVKPLEAEFANLLFISVKLFEKKKKHFEIDYLF